VERLYHCAGNTLVTGNDIAHALLDYARWLVTRREVDLVHVPTRAADGSIGRTAMLLTPTTQLSSETIASDGAELMDPEFVVGLRAAATRLRLPHPAVAEERSRVLVDQYDF
jgi:hypothetical protein